MNKITNGEQINTNIRGYKASEIKQEDNLQTLALDAVQKSDFLKRLEVNAPLSTKLEEDSHDSNWEVLETRTIAVDCAFVNLQASQVKQSTKTTFSNKLADAIFKDVVDGASGHLSFLTRNQTDTRFYSANIVPVCGTSLFL